MSDSSSNNMPTGPQLPPIGSVLRRFVKPRAAVERCDLCSAEVAVHHPHLVEPATRKMLCACQACAILFDGRSDAKYKRVPESIRYLPDFQLSDSQWEGLMIPINMAFFFVSSTSGKVVSLYPSPAGATESLLDLDSWQEIVANNHVLTTMEPDTQALLVNRVGTAAEFYLLPIDECYKLVGVIRTKWRGLSGGSEVWEAIAEFFAELKARSTGVNEANNA